MLGASRFLHTLLITAGVISLLAGADVFVTTWSNRGAPGQTITVCQATGVPAHPYQPVTVRVAPDGSLPKGFDPTQDVVPPYASSGRNYPGTNWSSQGQALWYAGCRSAGGSLSLSQTSPPAPATVAPQPQAGSQLPFGLRPTADLVQPLIRVIAAYLMFMGVVMIAAGALHPSIPPVRRRLLVSSDLSRYAKPLVRPHAPEH